MGGRWEWSQYTACLYEAVRNINVNFESQIRSNHALVSPALACSHLHNGVYILLCYLTHCFNNFLFDTVDMIHGFHVFMIKSESLIMHQCHIKERNKRTCPCGHLAKSKSRFEPLLHVPCVFCPLSDCYRSLNLCLFEDYLVSLPVPVSACCMKYVYLCVSGVCIYVGVFCACFVAVCCTCVCLCVCLSPKKRSAFNNKEGITWGRDGIPSRKL